MKNKHLGLMLAALCWSGQVQAQQTLLPFGHTSVYQDPTSLKDSLTWECKFYETSHNIPDPAVNWYAPDFDASNWVTGQGPYMSLAFENYKFRYPNLHLEGNPSSDYYVRRTFHIDDVQKIKGKYYLYMLFGKYCQAYLNGTLIYEISTYNYVRDGWRMIELTPSQMALLKNGTNVLAVHTTIDQHNLTSLDCGINTWRPLMFTNWDFASIFDSNTLMHLFHTCKVSIHTLA